MHLFRPSNMMADIIFEDPSAINLINRFGLYLGVGDKTIEECCNEHNVELDFFLAIVNTFFNSDYFPKSIFKNIEISKIVNYLEKTNLDLKEYELPNIERHFQSLIKRSDKDNSNLPLLLNFFFEMKDEIYCQIEFDKEKLFPYLLSKDANLLSDSEIERFLNKEEDVIEDKLNDLLGFFVIHLKGKYDWNLCRAVVNAVFTLAKEIRQNNRIRNHILVPIIGRMKSVEI